MKAPLFLSATARLSSERSFVILYFLYVCANFSCCTRRFPVSRVVHGHDFLDLASTIASWLVDGFNGTILALGHAAAFDFFAGLVGCVIGQLFSTVDAVIVLSAWELSADRDLLDDGQPASAKTGPVAMAASSAADALELLRAAGSRVGGACGVVFRVGFLNRGVLSTLHAVIPASKDEDALTKVIQLRSDPIFLSHCAVCFEFNAHPSVAVDRRSRAW